MNGLIPDQYEGELDGRIELLGKSLGEFLLRRVARTIGNVFQESDRSVLSPARRPTRVALVGENLGMPREELIERVESAFESMKIAHLAGKDPHRPLGRREAARRHSPRRSSTTPR